MPKIHFSEQHPEFENVDVDRSFLRNPFALAYRALEMGILTQQGNIHGNEPLGGWMQKNATSTQTLKKSLHQLREQRTLRYGHLFG